MFPATYPGRVARRTAVTVGSFASGPWPGVAAECAGREVAAAVHGKDKLQ